MSHEAHHGEPKVKTQAAGKSSQWFVIILVGLFIAGVNFVNVMGHDDGHGGAGHATETHTTQGAGHIEGTPQDNIGEDPGDEQRETSDTPHQENAPHKTPSEAEEQGH